MPNTLVKARLGKLLVDDKWKDLQKQLKKMHGQVQKLQNYKTILSYLMNYTTVIEWYAECSFSNKQCILVNRTRENTEDMTDYDGKLGNSKEKWLNLKQKSGNVSDLQQ